ncbi:MAG: flavocytochrome c [Clostridiales Family XIII bacterium]|jgi:fumarate reductase flavoprotein subunit|nr:flavocytochrome c [Clostridiales Family XIII bacterium]
MMKTYANAQTQKEAEREIGSSFGAPAEWTEETDVVVVGSGFAGLAAAAEAALAGARTVVLEKMAHFGGNSLISGGGYCCWDSKLKLREKLGLGDDSWQSHMRDTLRGGAYYNDPELVEVLVREAPEGLDWLVDAGAVFEDTLPRIGGHSAHRSHQGKNSSGAHIVQALKRLATERGADLRLNAKVTGIWRKDANACVSGVRVVSEGVTRDIRALRGVILASGGYGRDLALRLNNNPRLVESLNCTNHSGATGEMIRHAKAIGADTVHMAFVQLYPCAAPRNGAMDRFAFDCYSGPGYGLIYVNRAGERFVNELAGRDEVSDAQVLCGEKPTWSVLNGRIFEKLTTPPKTIQKGIDSGRLLKGDSLSALAEKAGLPPAALENSVRAHNGAITAQEDTLFHKPMSPYMIPLEEPPFYALAQWPAVHYCMGGIRINAQCGVFDIWGDLIPGLYAAGEVCGGIHGANRLGGNAIAECVVFGRRAGKVVSNQAD